MYNFQRYDYKWTKYTFLPTMSEIQSMQIFDHLPQKSDTFETRKLANPSGISNNKRQRGTWAINNS